MTHKVKSCGNSYVFVPMLISHTGTLVTHRQTGSPLSSNFSFSFYVCVCVRWWCLQVGDGSTLIDHQARDLQMMMEMTWWLRMRWWMAFISRLTNRQWLHRWLRPILLWISDEDKPSCSAQQHGAIESREKIELRIFGSQPQKRRSSADVLTSFFPSSKSKLV